MNAKSIARTLRRANTITLVPVLSQADEEQRAGVRWVTADRPARRRVKQAAINASQRGLAF